MCGLTWPESHHMSTRGLLPELRRVEEDCALHKITASLAVKNALDAEKEYNSMSLFCTKSAPNHSCV